MSKLAVFDFDSTLMDGETIDFFAEELGFKEQVVAITGQSNGRRTGLLCFTGRTCGTAQRSASK